MTDLRNIAYMLLLLAAVFMGHYTTKNGGDVKCFAPINLEAGK